MKCADEKVGVAGQRTENRHEEEADEEVDAAGEGGDACAAAIPYPRSTLYIRRYGGGPHEAPAHASKSVHHEGYLLPGELLGFVHEPCSMPDNPSLEPPRVDISQNSISACWRDRPKRLLIEVTRLTNIPQVQSPKLRLAELLRFLRMFA